MPRRVTANDYQLTMREIESDHNLYFLKQQYNFLITILSSKNSFDKFPDISIDDLPSIERNEKLFRNGMILKEDYKNCSLRQHPSQTQPQIPPPTQLMHPFLKMPDQIEM